MNITGLLCLIALAFSFAGCSKQRSDLALDKAKRNLDKARSWNAAEFPDSKSAFESAESSYKSAQSSFQANQYSTALQQAKEAVDQSKTAMEQAKALFADKQVNTAQKSIEVARINDGPRENADLFEEAEQKLNEAQEKFGKQKFEDAINLATESISKVEQLLAPVKNASTNRLAELDSTIRELEKEQADRFVPNALINAKEAREQVSKKIDQDRDYKQAIILAGTAVSEAQAGVTETKKRRSHQELQTLESMIAEAIAEEAAIYAPEALRTSQESFEEILRSFYENQYDTVLAAADLLRPKVQTLITMTRIEATKEKLRAVQQAITALRDQAVEQYLPGRLSAMENLHAQGQDLFNNSDYDGAKERANQALVENDRIVADFDDLAEKAVSDARDAFQTARNTFNRMSSLFDGNTRAVDQRMESGRQVSAENLSGRLAAAEANLSLAAQNREVKQFKKSIELAKEVEQSAENVETNTYRLVAEHKLIGIQDEISGLMRQGAREYAPRQLERVRQLVQETQQLIDENKNREAVERASKTRASLDNVKQELARKASQERQRGIEAIRRIEGGAAPTPPAGGQNGRRNNQRRNNGTEAPGGAALNNKEAMLEEAAELASSHPWAEPLVIAQLRAGAPTNSSGGTGDAVYFDNRRLTDGTFMHDQAPTAVFTRTGEPNGTIVGTRPEPIVPTTEMPGSGSSLGSYESPTGPGPFQAVTRTESVAFAPTDQFSPAAATIPAEAGETHLSALRRRIADILANEERLRDIRRFQPRAIERARAKLDESSEALAAGNYLAALTMAEEAQQILIEAETRAARSAAMENLQSAADRINVAAAAGALAFAPAQLTEAINLYEQAEFFLEEGDSLQARELSAQAIVAADDARLYNVNKARDLAALSTRYGGWKASHPLLAQAENNSAIAEALLSRPETAETGQEVAKQAVVQAQLALDHARDFTFQERIDNIYKALNTALRAGANYFNVNEVRRLIAELSVARDEYCTRNFDAVELKLKDIEARLARVIETTPLVLEENLVEVTNKLNALVLAGAENYMAQEVDDVKSLMNRSVIDFRKHDYYSSYTNLKNAIRLTDVIELRLQEQVYFDAVTELFAQLDKVFHDFERILRNDPAFLKKLVTTPSGQMAAIEFSGRMSPNDFRDRITDIYLRAIHTKPPASQEGTHQEVLLAIKYAKAAAENYQRLYIMDQLSKPDAYEVIDTAYNHVKKAQLLRSELQVRLIDPMARRKVLRAEKIVNY